MTGDTNDPRLGGWAISQEVVNVISNLIQPGSIILELGSGTGTGLLSENYQMISIENNPEFLDLEDTRYIHAPIVPLLGCLSLAAALEHSRLPWGVGCMPQVETLIVLEVHLE